MNHRPQLPPTKHLSTCIFKTIPVTSQLGAHLTIEFIKHVLFMRQQIPSTYLELEKVILTTRTTQAEESTQLPTEGGRRKRKRRLTAGFDKKASKAYDELQILFAAIGTLFQTQSPSMVVIALGSSPATAVEKFALHFGYPQTQTNSNDSKMLSEHQLNLCTRKLIRGIFQNAGQLFQTVIRPTKLFVVARAPPSEIIAGNSFVVDWNLNPLKRRKGKRGVPTWIIRLRGLGSKIEEEEEEKEEELKTEEGKKETSDANDTTIESQVTVPDTSIPIMSLSDDPAAFVQAMPTIIGVPLYLLPDNGIEIWCKFPKGIKGVKGKK